MTILYNHMALGVIFSLKYDKINKCDIKMKTVNNNNKKALFI